MAKFRLIVVAASIVITASACAFVYPTPPEGEPVPELTISVSQAEPLSGLVTVTATPVNFTPDEVRLRHVNSPVGPVIDTSAPFEATFDTALVNDGYQSFVATGVNATYTVVGSAKFLARNDPNLVYIFVDDLDETTTTYWDAMPQTQALLADSGLVFQNAFATDPVCCPARASTLTGRYPHNTAVFDNTAPDGGFTAFRDSGAEADTVATRLQAAGYSTSFIGKYLHDYWNDPGYVPPGWNEWFAFNGLADFYDGYDYTVNHNGVTETYGSTAADYQTDVLAAQALSFIDSTESNDIQPFFLFLSPSAPHVPLLPAPRHQPNPFGGEVAPQRPNFDEPDVSDKPTWLRDGVPQLTATQLAAIDDTYRNRLGTMLAVDEMVASVVAQLDANGELDDTVFFFTSDNGFNLGAHRLQAKQVPYEESIRVPLVVAGSGVVTGVDDHLVTHVDMTPTLLDLAGSDWSDLDGTSIAPLLEGTSPAWRSDFLVEFNGTYYPFSQPYDTLEQVQNGISSGKKITVPTYRAVRSTQWLYVEWYGGTAHEYELYDMVNDPYQLQNLVATPEGAQQHAATTTALQARLDFLKACAGADCRS